MRVLLMMLLASVSYADFSPLPANTKEQINQNFQAIDEEIARIGNAVANSTVTVNAPILGDGSSTDPLRLDTSSVTLQGQDKLVFRAGDTMTGTLNITGPNSFLTTGSSVTHAGLMTATRIITSTMTAVNKIGIGTSTQPFAALHISSGGIYVDGNAANALTMQGSLSTIIKTSGGHLRLLTLGNADEVRIGNTVLSNDAVVIGNNNANALVVKNNKVGIAGESNPDDSLDVIGSAQIKGTTIITDANLRIDRAAPGNPRAQFQQSSSDRGLVTYWNASGLFCVTRTDLDGAGVCVNASNNVGINVAPCSTCAFQVRGNTSIAGNLTVDGLVVGGIAAGATNYIQNRNTLQAGATFYVSSGTVQNYLTINGQDAIGYSLILSSGIYSNGVFRSTATQTNVILNLQNDNFFRGGCGDNQYLAGISSNGVISCGNNSVGGGDPIVGNEVVDSANATLLRSGSGTFLDPYKLALNLGSTNTWSAAIHTLSSFTVGGSTFTVDGGSATIAYNLRVPTIDFPAFTADPAAPPVSNVRLYSFEQNGIVLPQIIEPNGLTLSLVRDNVRRVRNTSGSTITKGKVVYVTGSTGSTPNIALAKADSVNTMPAAGITVESINNNAFGLIMTIGVLNNIDTSLFNEGDTLFVSSVTAGEFATEDTSGPSYPSLNQAVALVRNSGVGNGSIGVDIAATPLGLETGTIKESFAVGGSPFWQVVLRSTSTTQFRNPGGIDVRYGVRAATGVFTSSVTVSGDLVANNLVVLGTGTIRGNAFSVGGSSFTVAGGSVTTAFSNTTNGQLIGNNVLVIAGTATIRGNAFSVGGSSFSVAGGSVTTAFSNTTNGQLIGNNTLVIVGTATIRGNAFSVGGSSFTVAGGSVTTAFSHVIGGQAIVLGTATIRGHDGTYSLKLSSGLDAAAGIVLSTTTRTVRIQRTDGTNFFQNFTCSDGFYLNSVSDAGIGSCLPTTFPFGDPVIGNEVVDATNNTLIRSGAGTEISPYTLALNLNTTNYWNAAIFTRSTMAVLGNAFSVGGSSFTVAGGTATIGHGLTVGGQIVGNDGLVLLGTATIQGSEFSVGGSSFVVTGGSATLAYRFTPGSIQLGDQAVATSLLTIGSTTVDRVTFDAGGNMQFGSGSDFLVGTGNYAFRSAAVSNAGLRFDTNANGGFNFRDTAGQHMFRLLTTGESRLGPIAVAGAVSTFTATGFYRPAARTAAQIAAHTPAANEVGGIIQCSDCTIPYSLCIATGTTVMGFRLEGGNNPCQ